MAGRRSRDHSSSTKGGIESQGRSLASVSRVLGDEQTLVDRDQTLADADQTGSDSNQTAADSDQSGADRDQVAADNEQAASDRDHDHGGDPGVYVITRDIRDRSAEQRRHFARLRVEASVTRDAVADARDLAASTRDQAAAVRDRQLATRDARWIDHGRAVTGTEVVLRAAEDRGRAADDRAEAARNRAQATTDREQAARDREQAARDRLQSRADRDALLLQLAIAETDALTGTRTRAAGLADLQREIDRARRTTGSLVAAYVDVVGLKTVNDGQGHAAGDALLQRAVRAIRGNVRSYDPIVSLGGDEFLCVLSATTIEEARQRFAAVQAVLASDPDPCEIKVGFAVLAPSDRAADLIERADADLPASRGR